MAKSAGACLVWDAAFADLTYDVPPLPDATLLYDRAITFGTLSKGYGLPGLRAGWCIGPPEIVNACAAIRDYTSLALSPLIELVAVRAVCGAGQTGRGGRVVGGAAPLLCATREFEGERPSPDALGVLGLDARVGIGLDEQGGAPGGAACLGPVVVGGAKSSSIQHQTGSSPVAATRSASSGPWAGLSQIGTGWSVPAGTTWSWR